MTTEHRAAHGRAERTRAPLRLHAFLLASCILGVTAALAAPGCERGRATGPAPAASPTTSVVDAAGPPTARLYVISDLAGALEPCGCTKDQLGGVNHLAAYLHAEASKAPASALVSAGPLFFMDPTLKPERASQDLAKATTLAEALKTMGFVAFAPGRNDLAAGPAALEKLGGASGGDLLLANGAALESAVDGGAKDAGALVATSPVRMLSLNGLSVAIVGVGALGAKTTPLDALRDGVAKAQAQGAQAIVALASVGRGEAKRIADVLPELTAIVVGSAGGEGEANTSPPPPEQVGSVLIAETGNHLTTVGVLDLFVRGTPAPGLVRFADGSGLELGQKRADLTRRIDERRARIAIWEKDPNIAKADLDARRAEVTKLEAERASLDTPRPPERPGTSFFRYSSQEVRASLGDDPAVGQAMHAYYKQINDANRDALANKATIPAAPGQPTYVGIEACSGCHAGARQVWDRTAHAHAYATLADQDKQFNLDCVSCHVTGYERPGGSNVTHVKGLESVQCEVCHGPGSTHARTPAVAMPVASPGGDLCLSCHHPPHVEGFEPRAKMAAILGPGHGR